MRWKFEEPRPRKCRWSQRRTVSWKYWRVLTNLASRLRRLELRRWHSQIMTRRARQVDQHEWQLEPRALLSLALIPLPYSTVGKVEWGNRPREIFGVPLDRLRLSAWPTTGSTTQRPTCSAHMRWYWQCSPTSRLGLREVCHILDRYQQVQMIDLRIIQSVEMGCSWEAVDRRGYTMDSWALGDIEVRNRRTVSLLRHVEKGWSSWMRSSMSWTLRMSCGMQSKGGRYTGVWPSYEASTGQQTIRVWGEGKGTQAEEEASDILNTNKYKACFRSGSFIKNQFGKRFVRMKTNSTRLSVHAQMMDKRVSKGRVPSSTFFADFFSRPRDLVTCNFFYR